MTSSSREEPVPVQSVASTSLYNHRSLKEARDAAARVDIDAKAAAKPEHSEKDSVRLARRRGVENPMIVVTTWRASLERQ